MAITTKKPAQATKKDTTAPTKKAPTAKATAPKSTAKPAPKAIVATAPSKDTASEVKARKAEAAAKAEATKKPTPKPKKPADLSKMETTTNPNANPKTTSTGKTAYHVSKRDNDGREWKVFIQGSDKVIKLFKTQADALGYAKGLAKNKDDGSYVILHGLDGKIRRY